MAHFSGISKGKDAVRLEYLQEEARLTKELQEFKRKFNDELTQKEVLEEALLERLKEDDEKAINDPDSTNRCISVDGLRRLNQGFGFD